METIGIEKNEDDDKKSNQSRSRTSSESSSSSDASSKLSSSDGETAIANDVAAKMEISHDESMCSLFDKNFRNTSTSFLKSNEKIYTKDYSKINTNLMKLRKENLTCKIYNRIIIRS